MFNKKMCFTSRLIMKVLTVIILAICFINSSKITNTMVGGFFIILYIVFTVVIYWIYLKSNTNKWIGYLLALLTFVIWHIANCLFYHFRTNFRYWGTGLGTELSTGLFIILHLAIGLICGAIYFIRWIRNRK